MVPAPVRKNSMSSDPLGVLERRPSFIEEDDIATAPLPAVIVVDPISTGAVLAYLAHKKGYRVVAVFTDNISEELMSFVPSWCVEGGLVMEATIKHTGNVEATVSRIKKLEHLDIRQIMVGCESGVELNDRLCEAFDFPNNGTELSEARRDKHIMGETICAAGVRGVRQKLVSRWEEVPPFVASLGQAPGRMKIVIKPTKSAGTDQVYFASSMEEAKAAVDAVLSSTTVFGEANDSVLVQEYLAGREYVVDCVSFRGEHKVCAFWVYDKRRTNDSQFVYYGLRLFETGDRALEERLARYTFSCLDALGVRNGPSHSEVIWLEEENQPCLVEVGARPHGGEGTFVSLTAGPIGYNQLSVMLNLVDDPTGATFKALPRMPAPLKAHAAEACLVSFQEGRLSRFLPGLDEIKAMPSFKSVDFTVRPGSKIHRTVDILSSPGSVLLAHRDRATLERDYERIHELERHELFSIETDT